MAVDFLLDEGKYAGVVATRLPTTDQKIKKAR